MSDNMDKCKWFMGIEFKPCNKKHDGDSDYCKLHLYVDNYTDAEKINKKYCSSCRKVKNFPNDAKTCGCANERITKANEKRNAETKIIMDIKKEEYNKKELEKQKLVKEEGYKICKSCDIAAPAASFIGVSGNITLNCLVCRDKQKVLDTKRTTKRDWHKEYENNPELYQRKLEYNKTNPNNSEYQKKCRNKKKETE